MFKEIVAYDCSWVQKGIHYMTIFHLVDPTEEKRRSVKGNVLFGHSWKSVCLLKQEPAIHRPAFRSQGNI